MQTTLDLQNAKKTKIQYRQVSVLFLNLESVPFFTKWKKWDI